jgi:hypothetical protein
MAQNQNAKAETEAGNFPVAGKRGDQLVSGTGHDDSKLLHPKSLDAFHG